MKKIFAIFGVTFLFLLAFGCGQKGPLYLPLQKAALVAGGS